MDYFFRGEHERYIINSERVESLPDLRRRMRAAVPAVSVDVLSLVWAELEFRFDVCIAVSSAHIEFQ
jgi:hypothetical protein